LAAGLMQTTTQVFAIHLPDSSGKYTERIVSIDVPVRWDDLIDDWILTEEAHEMIDRRKVLEMGSAGKPESTSQSAVSTVNSSTPTTRPIAMTKPSKIRNELIGDGGLGR
jgi:hypothetical protein